MLDMELKSRARRVIEGRFTGSDLDRLYLGLREDAKNAFCFRDIGDFIAHRDERGRGITTETGRDVYTSVSVWSMKLRGLEPSLADVKRAGEANLRLMSDEQIKGLFRLRSSDSNDTFRQGSSQDRTWKRVEGVRTRSAQ